MAPPCRSIILLYTLFVLFAPSTQAQKVAVAGTLPGPKGLLHKVVCLDLDHEDSQLAYPTIIGRRPSLLFSEDGTELIVASLAESLVAGQNSDLVIDVFSTTNNTRLHTLEVEDYFKLGAEYGPWFQPHEAATDLARISGTKEYLLLAGDPSNYAKPVESPYFAPGSPEHSLAVIRFDSSKILSSSPLRDCSSFWASFMAPLVAPAGTVLAAGGFTAIFTPPATTRTPITPTSPVAAGPPDSLGFPAKSPFLDSRVTVISHGPVFGFNRDWRCIGFPLEQFLSKAPIDATHPAEVLDFAPIPGAVIGPLSLHEIPGTSLIFSLNHAMELNDPLPNGLRTRRPTNKVQIVTYDWITKAKLAGPIFDNQVLEAFPTHDGKKIVVLAKRPPQIRVLSLPDLKIVHETNSGFDTPLSMAVH